MYEVLCKLTHVSAMTSHPSLLSLMSHVQQQLQRAERWSRRCNKNMFRIRPDLVMAMTWVNICNRNRSKRLPSPNNVSSHAWFAKERLSLHRVDNKWNRKFVLLWTDITSAAARKPIRRNAHRFHVVNGTKGRRHRYVRTRALILWLTQLCRRAVHASILNEGCSWDP